MENCVPRASKVDPPRDGEEKGLAEVEKIPKVRMKSVSQGKVEAPKAPKLVQRETTMPLALRSTAVPEGSTKRATELERQRKRRFERFALIATKLYKIGLVDRDA